MLSPLGSLPVPNPGPSVERQGAVWSNEERAMVALFPASRGRGHDGPGRKAWGQVAWPCSKRPLGAQTPLLEANSLWAQS